VGLLLIGASAAVALTGADILHFWLALVLPGVGWNFGFLGATAIVADCQSPSERVKVQGTNDFLVFGSVACASFFAGSLLHSSGRTAINWLVLPCVSAAFSLLAWGSGRRAILKRLNA